ncbi:hypothetical protein KKJ06_22200 [Xenorhabdus bovienii]|uniref:hypothetical protein n=1 Tax=Xenorhabdus bovienii TaxID=40576 RepID=UPI0012D36CCE|nr:hypothetical protein [Xenorhabdus bovienii]MDE9455962.1 hypothetical protein [Xenorhabdus bovienii]MDE9483864.1 hypothetical protein [Xenorhabdus bovienii]MDE9545219.1 hypothetical protein [Xenorhabdus bovienii]MDE9553349.1 hypothetical protein [Xenorhabdus bovienii]MDE9558010.1 hypothetical protein [Xenorhabdus bovienii]
MPLTQRVHLIDIYPDAHMYISSTFHDGYVINELTIACHGLAVLNGRPESLAINNQLWTYDIVARYIQSNTTVEPLHRIHILACNSANYDIASLAAKVSAIIRNTEVKGYVGSAYINFRHNDIYQNYLDNGSDRASVERYLEHVGNNRVHTNNVPNYYCKVFKNGIMERQEYLTSAVLSH